MARYGFSAGSLARNRLTGVVEKNPGVHVSRLSLITGLSWNTCLHHLRILERQGQLVSRKVNAKLCWFDVRQGAQRSKQATCLLRDPMNLRIAELVLASPGSSQIELARALDLAASVIHRRLSALEAAGLLLRKAESRSKFVFPSDRLHPMTISARQTDSPTMVGWGGDPFGRIDGVVAAQTP